MTSTAASLSLAYTTLQTNFTAGPCLLQLNSEETDFSHRLAVLTFFTTECWTRSRQKG